MKATSSKSEAAAKAGSSNYLGNIQPVGFPPLPADWGTETETFPDSENKIKLFAAFHRPNGWPGSATESARKEGRPHRALLVTHGLNEHGGRYLHLPHFLQGAVDSVYCYDQRGHGRSEGIVGYCDRFGQFTDDMALAVRHLDQRLREQVGAGNYEIHLLAHSMGGLVGLRTLFLHPNLPVRSAIISSPLLGISVPLPAAKVIAARLLSKVWGSLQMLSEVDPGLLSRDPEVAKAYVKDRLVHHKGTPRIYTEIQSAIADTMSRDTGIGCPLLMVVTMADRIVNPSQSVEFFNQLKHSHKELKTYDGFYHEGMNDFGKEKIFKDIETWILAHTKRSAKS